MKLKEIPQNTVVHTPTEAEVKELLAILHENGWIINGCANYAIKNAEGIQIESETNWSWWEKIENVRKENRTILTLAEFKERYCEDEKPHPKFAVGDKVKIVNVRNPMMLNEIGIIEEHAAKNSSLYKVKWCEDSSTFIEDVYLEPYTEPETKTTEDMETKELNRCEKCGANTQQCMDAPCQNYPVEKELNLCELLRGHEGESIFLTTMGEVLVEKVSEEHLFFRLKANEPGWRLNANGKMNKNGLVITYPSRSLYEQYPLDPYTAWMKWQEEQKKPFICIHWGEVDCNGDEEEDYTGNIYFRTPADRDKCIEEIKAIVEMYSK